MLFSAHVSFFCMFPAFTISCARVRKSHSASVHACHALAVTIIQARSSYPLLVLLLDVLSRLHVVQSCARTQAYMHCDHTCIVAMH